MGRGQRNLLYGPGARQTSPRRGEKLAELKRHEEELEKARAARRTPPSREEYNLLRRGGSDRAIMARKYALDKAEVGEFFLGMNFTYPDFLRWMYPPGTTVRLEQPLQGEPYGFNQSSGMIGTLDSIDDLPSIFVNWENGSSISVIVGEDQFSLLVQKV